jgi:carboxypeptidase Taq
MTNTESAAPNSAYRELESRFRRLAALGEALSVLHWDTAVMMPPGGAEARSDQIAALKLTKHELLTEPRVAELLAAAEPEVAGDPWRAANLREMRRQLVHAAGVPKDLVEAHSKACTACEMIWRDARPASDFARAAPALAEVLRLTREVAEAKAAALNGEGSSGVRSRAPNAANRARESGARDLTPSLATPTLSPYEALLDQYEPGARTARVDALFADLAAFLPDFLEDALARQAARPEPLPLPGPFPVAAQAALGRRLMHLIGFDFDHGRLDVSLHPFCGGVPEDVRITTRYEEGDFTQSLMGVLHETGHAMYEMGLPPEWRRQPVGRARGMAMHESQSLLVEMQACRSREFVEFVAPLLVDAFGVEAFGRGGVGAQAENLHRHYTRIERGFIRVDADEVTYPAHVILRYRLERAMIAGALTVPDLPAAWNDGMRELLHIVPPDDALGCLQDIHWYDGAMGYFPTYTMGALAAAQLFAAAKRARPEIPGSLAKGDFAPLMGWLRENVHAKASLHTTDEILTQATGAALGTETFKRHVRERYLG